MLMNKNSGPPPGEAKLQYGPNGFRVLRTGNHVFGATPGCGTFWGGELPAVGPARC